MTETKRRLPCAVPFLGVSLAVFAAALPARAAPTPHECATASEDAAAAQKQEKLSTAKDRFLACADAACPAEIRDECGQRLKEVNDAMPTIVFDVKDAAGNDVAGARVTMDGNVLVDHLGAAALSIDPGSHVFRFETADPSQTIEKTFVVRDAEKNRHLAVTLAGTPPPSAQGGAASSWSTQKTVAVILGLAAVGSLVAGSATGALTFSDWSHAKTECATACGSGSQAQSDKSSASTLATVSDATFIAAGVLAAATAIVWLTAPSGAHVQVAPAVGAQGGGLVIGGTF